jgi:hypothetical protein
MKKRGIIILSIVLIAVAATFALMKSMFVSYSVIAKEEKRFCPPTPQHLLLAQDPNRKLIKTGDLSFECERLGETLTRVEQAVKELGGFISDERLNMYEKRSLQWLEIRVPAGHFDALVETISSGASRLEERSVSIEDVTDQYLDTETRLAVKRELEARYRELLQDAESVKDVLAIEEQIGKLREEIESAEGQIKRFDDQIALSTLEVTFYEVTEGAPVRFARYFRKGINNGWENLVWFFVGITNIWPFILIIAMVILGFNFRRNRNR